MIIWTSLENPYLVHLHTGNILLKPSIVSSGCIDGNSHYLYNMVTSKRLDKPLEAIKADCILLQC